MTEFFHYLQGELHENEQQIAAIPDQPHRKLALYTLRMRQTDLLTSLAVLNEYKRLQAEQVPSLAF